MASAIDTATAKPAESAPKPPGSRFFGRLRKWRLRVFGRRLRPRRGRRFLISPLTRRILAVNVLALALLAGGALYLGRYRASLIGQEIDSLKIQGEIFSAALDQGAVLDSVDEGEVLLPDLARQMMRRLVAPTRIRARLFDAEGNLIADSRALLAGGTVRVRPLAPPRASEPMLGFADRIYDWIARLFPHGGRYPLYPGSGAHRAEDFGEVILALRGKTGSAVRRDPRTGGLVISVAVPVERYRQVLGGVLLSTGSGEIETELRKVRLEMLRIFTGALLVTVLLSFYLAGTIVRPIRRLAAAAERARGRGARVEIPDFTGRGDEIGDLSHSFREMTDALWERMSAIESFAADVSHEIKNPLSSLKSAVETATRLEDPEKQKRLLAVVLDDIERLHRLITDISDASRLDAELSRIELLPVDIAAMLKALVEVHQASESEGAPRLVLELPDGERELIVSGIETRLSQVFRNVIANALSFSPAASEIRLSARIDGHAILVTVEDQGLGIPEDKLSAIFDRFYSERPQGEKFGTHSGLGLSISKQIVEAHRGMIWAENRRAANGEVTGARFAIRLPAL